MYIARFASANQSLLFSISLSSFELLIAGRASSLLDSLTGGRARSGSVLRVTREEERKRARSGAVRAGGRRFSFDVSLPFPCNLCALTWWNVSLGSSGEQSRAKRRYLAGRLFNSFLTARNVRTDYERSPE